MRIAKLLILTLVVPGVAFAHTGDSNQNTSRMHTRWAGAVNSERPLSEHPRPQLMRSQWQNLNGLWDYAIAENDAEVPSKYLGKILVPYPIESALSGVQRELLPEQRLWYRRTVFHEHGEQNVRTLLHFGAVDYSAVVYLNGKELGSHAGGYQNFTFDVTDALEAGSNELVVKVHDPTDTGHNPHGKQSLKPQGIVYTAASGIWQTVWLETVPLTYIERIQMTTDIDQGMLKLQVIVAGDQTPYTIVVSARQGASVVATAVASRGVAELRIPQPRLWSPEDPYLYGLDVRLQRSGKTVDNVDSYFGMRKVDVRKDSAGVPRIFVNNRYVYNLGVLDQGYWPDGIYTAPTDAALSFDIEAVKSMGFNTIRKHAKVEPARWYYHCDRLGLLVWQDMPAPAGQTPEAHAQFEAEVSKNLEQLHNHPAIVMWVLFNEGWGAYEQGRLARWMKQLDPSRLLNGHSGSFDDQKIDRWRRNWDPSTVAQIYSGEIKESTLFLRELRHGNFFDPAKWEASDVADVHVYPEPVLPPDVPGKARVLGEYGGIGVPLDGHTWGDLAGWGYAQQTPDQLLRTYEDLTRMLKRLESQGLSGSIYTQPFDVETEQNGLMTYDREVIKIPAREMRRINSMLNKAALNLGLGSNLSVRDADITPEAERYAVMLSRYREGNKEPAFLRRLALTAIRQNDQPTATAAGNAYIDQLQSPYGMSDWVFIGELTRTSKDRGFGLLQAQGERANAALGAGMAERKVAEVIKRDDIDPLVAEANTIAVWTKIEGKVAARHGDSAREVVYQAAMFHFLKRQDWLGFGKYFVAYFSSLADRDAHDYSVLTLSEIVAMHVPDPRVVDEALRFLGRELEVAKQSAHVASTYAKLLYKARRVQEAIAWQEKAVQLSRGKNELFKEELQQRLHEMQAQSAQLN